MDVRAILKISGGEAGFATTSGGVAPIPGITLGVITRLILDMRAEGGQDDVELPSIPAADLAGCDSYYIAIDNDWSQGTAPKMTRTSGISIVEEGGRTLFQAELPNTAAIAGLADAIEAAAAKSITLNCEIGGTKAGTGDVFAYNFSLVIRNRIWLPDGSPEDLPSDPDYLNTAQVTALINSAVASALEDIQGDPGPAPTITLGTVTSGATASATLTPGAEEGEYTLDLVLPQGAPGDEGEMPALAVGTVTEGEAAAEIVAGETGYVLNLTVPRGLPGAGVTPSGIWAAETTYALNDAVRYNGGWWRSLQAGNTGHTPPVGTDGDAWWEVIVKDGIDAEPFLRVYNDTDDVGDPDWHAEFQPGDTHFRDSVDGGATWTAPVLISIAHDVIVLFNIDATTDWTALTPGATYSTGTGKYMRARQEGGAWGAAYQIHELESQALRVQFSAGGASPTWHAALEAGDTLARFYNTLATIDVTVTISDGTFDVAEIQLCSIADPWHATYAAGDRYRKFSMDGGLTYGSPIPLFGGDGKSAYQAWLDLGNTGTVEDFLESLQGEPGPPGEGATPLSDAIPSALGTASAGSATAAARGDHAHPTTGLVLATEKGAANGVASLGADGLVPASQLPAISGGDALPTVTTADNGDVLTVVSGVWDKATAPVSATTANVQSALSINTSTGAETKVLSEKGTFVNLPVDTDTTYTAGTGIDITSKAISIATTGATTGQVLTKTANGIAWGDAAGGGTAITHLTLSVPAVGSDNTYYHLEVQTDDNASFTTPTTEIYTYGGITATNADWAKVFSGTTFEDFPENGLPKSYFGKDVLLDLSEADVPNYLRYRWRRAYQGHYVTITGAGDYSGTYYQSYVNDGSWVYEKSGWEKIIYTGGYWYLVFLEELEGQTETTMCYRKASLATGLWESEWPFDIAIGSGSGGSQPTGTLHIVYYIVGSTTWQGMYFPSISNTEYLIDNDCDIKVNVTGITGGEWIVGGVTYDSGDLATAAPGSITISFPPVEGYDEPADITFTATGGEYYVFNAAYTVAEEPGT